MLIRGKKIKISRKNKKKYKIERKKSETSIRYYVQELPTYLIN